MAFLTETRVSRQPTKSAQKRLMVAVRIRPLREKESGRVLHSVDEKVFARVDVLLTRTSSKLSCSTVLIKIPKQETNWWVTMVVVLEDSDVDRNDVLRHNRGGDRQYVYDAVFGEDSSQDSVYEKTTQGLARDVLRGYNATVFAYGATGSGKTHTMLGTSKQPGIMVRALNELFHHVKNQATPNHYNVTMSYLEIYNENIRDLLNPSTGHLELREDPREGSVQVVKLSEITTNSTEEVMRLLQKGNKARTVEPTSANKTSSRSHALLSVTVRQTVQVQKTDRMRARVKQGKLFMIDLAGSERASNTQNRGKRLVEGAHINRSLLALGNCINALSGGARYVNYRDSKLTRLLKDALSGNSHTCMVAHVSPAALHREETRNTLLYADRAKNITNKVGKNVLDISYHVSQYRTIISELRDEISRLRTKMSEDRGHEYNPSTRPPDYNRPLNDLPNDIKEKDALDKLLTKSDHMRKLKNEMVTTFKEQMRLRKKLLNIDSYLLGLEIEASRQHGVISDWEARNNRLYKNQAASGKLRYGTAPDPEDLEERERGISYTPVDKAWSEISYIEKEHDKYTEMKMSTERELENCKRHAGQLEKDLPERISSEEERELLTLVIRVHELEVDKIALQSERLMKQHELRQRDLAILRYDRQRQICEEIITRQRQIMEEGRMTLPPDLQELYQLYQQELHAASYSDGSLGEYGVAHSAGKLPPISNKPVDPHINRMGSLETGLDDDLRTPTSSASSDWLTSPLPPITQQNYVTSLGLTPANVLFPPISKSLPEFRHTNTGITGSRLPRPVQRNVWDMRE